MALLPFVDTHLHFCDFKLKPELRWDWLEPDFLHPVMGVIDGIKTERYSAPEFLGETRFAHVTKAVHVQAALGTPDPVRETAWLQQVADEYGLPHGIVAGAPLQDPGVAEVLERHAAFPLLRGIRDFAQGDYLVDEAFRRGYARLEQLDLVYDLDTVWQDMHKARDLAESFPGITLVLDHCGFPRSRDDEYFDSWRAAVQDLARAENVVVKISGLGMADPHWTVESFRPWVEECIAAFGVDRSFFGTNWPVDRLFSSYGDVLDAYAEIISGYSEAEQQALFSRNAERVYRL